MAVGAAAQRSAGQADLDVPGRGRLLEVTQLQRRGSSPDGVVLVRDRGSEHAVEVGALVAQRELEDVAPVRGHDPLRTTDERIQLRYGLGVVVVVDPAEPQEHGDREPQLGEELAVAGPQPLVDGGQQPGPDEILGEGRGFHDRRPRDIDIKRGEHGVVVVRLLVAAHLAQRHPTTEAPDRGCLEHDLALLGVVLRLGEIVDQPAREHVDELDLGVADEEPASLADGDRDLHRQADLGAARRRDQPGAADRLLHREGRGAGSCPVVAVDPARDRVAREVDDVAAEGIELADHGVEHAADVRRQLLRPALGSQLPGEGLGQRREPADVREQRGARDAVGHLDRLRQGTPAIPRDVRLGVVVVERRRRLPYENLVVQRASLRALPVWGISLWVVGATGVRTRRRSLRVRMEPMSDWRSDRIGSALRGENPTVLARLPAGFAVIGDVQWLPGYCVLLSDDPAAERLSDLAPGQRSAFLDSMARLAAAVERACAASDPALRRVNIEILGNADAFLHAHIWPRYAWEPEELRTRPVWLYPVERWHDPATALGPQHDDLRAAISANLSAA